MALGKAGAKGTRAEADERLLVQAAQNDPSRFSELYQLHFERVYAYVARRVRNRDVAEDLTSDVFHKALAALPQFYWRGIPFGAWLIRIASNLVADRWKQASREVVDDPPEASFEVDLAEVEHRARRSDVRLRLLQRPGAGGNAIKLGQPQMVEILLEAPQRVSVRPSRRRRSPRVIIQPAIDELAARQSYRVPRRRLVSRSASRAARNVSNVPTHRFRFNAGS